MNYRKLGNSPFNISEISLGCMSLPTVISEAKYVIDAAIDMGINYFDTADLYDFGKNEEMIGTLIKTKRQEIHIATKVGNQWIDGQQGWTWNASPSYIEKAVKESLKRLKTDYIDLYQLHGGTIQDDMSGIIQTFEKLKKEGYIREYGISSIRPNVFVPFMKNSHAISNMMQFNLLDRRAEEWFDNFDKQNVSVVTRGSIAKGLLSNNWQAKLSSYMSYSKEEVSTTLTQLQAHYGNLHALAIAFNLHFPTVASTVIGARTKEQLLENIKAYEDSKRINDFSFATKILKKDIYTEHR